MMQYLILFFAIIKNNFNRTWIKFSNLLFGNNYYNSNTLRQFSDSTRNKPYEDTMILLLNQFLHDKRFYEAGLLSELFAIRGCSPMAFISIEVNARMGLFHHAGFRTALGKLHLNNANTQQLGLHASDIVSRHCPPELVEWCLEVSGAISDPQHHLALANSYEKHHEERWLAHLNNYLAAQSINALKCHPVDSDFFLGLASNFENSPNQSFKYSTASPLVTVCIACYNAESFVEIAVNSILNQTYRNLEILLFNDKSTDGTHEILIRLAQKDERIVVIDNPVNQGTYASRNEAFQRARGEFFTVLDADDFALPERLDIQIRHMQENPQHIGVMTHWVRMQPNGRFHFRTGWGGVYQHPAVATLLIRTREARESVGYWDCVRFSADTEYQHRLYKVWGRNNCPTLKVPTVIALYHEKSLTNHPVTGISVNGVSGFSATRIAYRDSWTRWHKGGDRLYLPYPPSARKFPAPPEMLL